MKIRRAILWSNIALAAVGCANLGDLSGASPDASLAVDAARDSATAPDASASDASISDGNALPVDATILDSSTATADGGDTSDASDGAFDAGPANLLTNSGFETGSIACGPGWSTMGTNTTATFSSTAHSGAHSCMVCGGYAAQLYQQVNVALDAGTNLGFNGYLRTDSDAGDAGLEVQLLVRALPADGGLSEQVALASGTFPSSSWTSLVQTGTLSTSIEQLEVTYILLGAGCIYVDDVSATLQ